MAAKATKLSSTLVIKYINGVDANGNDIIKSQRFSKVKTTVAEQDL